MRLGKERMEYDRRKKITSGNDENIKSVAQQLKEKKLSKAA